MFMITHHTRFHVSIDRSSLVHYYRKRGQEICSMWSTTSFHAIVKICLTDMKCILQVCRLEARVFYSSYWKGDNFLITPCSTKHAKNNSNSSETLCTPLHKATLCGWIIIIILKLWQSF